MLNLCFVAAMTASMISNAPADRTPTVIDRSAALMPAVGMPPPPGTRMLGMSITPDNPDAPVIYRVGSALSADDFLKAYAMAAADAGLRVSQAQGNRITGMLKTGENFSLDVAASDAGSGSTGVLIIRPGPGR